MSDHDLPPGWNYNPSSWPQRLPVVGLALVGFGIATYLALYQYGVFATVWEPFFGEGSRVVLHSRVSNVIEQHLGLPITDAALGAFGYLLDALTGLIGGKRRWRTMPWMVILFGLAVGPLGAVSIVLVILQPVLFESWCTLCLASAVISIGMIGPAMDEVLASLQYIRREQLHGRSAWRAFWGLGNHRDHDSADDTDRLTQRGKVQPVWTQFVSAALGVCLIAVPAVLGDAGSARINDSIIGPLVASIAVIAIWEATRPFGRVNGVLGLWLLIAPWILGTTWTEVLTSSMFGGLLLALALVPGKVRNQFGGGWSSLWRRTAEPGVTSPTRN